MLKNASFRSYPFTRGEIMTNVTAWIGVECLLHAATFKAQTCGLVLLLCLFSWNKIVVLYNKGEKKKFLT